MNGWLALQFVIDIVIFIFIIMIIFKGVLNKKKEESADVVEIRLLLDEVNQSMERNTMVAKKIQEELKEYTNIMAVQEAVKRKKATAAVNARAEQLPLAGQDDTDEMMLPEVRVLSDKKRNVKTLYKQGISKEGISDRLAIPLPEVELIIAMIGESQNQ